MKPRKSIIEDRFGRRRVAVGYEAALTARLDEAHDQAERAGYWARAAEAKNRQEYERGATDMLKQEYAKDMADEVIDRLVAAYDGELRPIAERLVQNLRRRPPRLSVGLHSGPGLGGEVRILRGVIPETNYSVVMG